MGQPLGIRIAIKGMELIGTSDRMKMIVFIENDRCIADAIQVVTGTRIGRRSAKLVNYGKMAATFINTDTGAAYRVNIRYVNPHIKHSDEAKLRVLEVPDAELLAWRKVTVAMKPEEYPGRPMRTANCVLCGEKVFDGRDIAGEDGPLCESCAHGAYYDVIEDDDETR